MNPYNTAQQGSADHRSRLRRREKGRIRRASYWAQRMQAAASPAERAAVAWDHFRARVATLPEEKRARELENAVIALSRICPDRGSVRHRISTTPTA